MTDVIILNLPYPISENRYWATRVYTPAGGGKPRAMTYVTKEAEAYRQQVQHIALDAGLSEPLQGRVELSYRLYPHRPQDWKKRMRSLGPEWDDSVQCLDVYNAIKVAADAMQGVIYVDDKQIWGGTNRREEPDEYGARLVVYVRKIPPKAAPAPEQEALL